MIFFGISVLQSGVNLFQKRKIQNWISPKTNFNDKDCSNRVWRTACSFNNFDASKDKNKNLAYDVTYVDYPDSVINSDSKEKFAQFFKNEAARVATSLHGNLDHETKDSILTYPGMEIKISFKDGQIIYRGKEFIVRNRLYSINVITDAKKDFNKEIDHFLGTFKLLWKTE